MRKNILLYKLNVYKWIIYIVATFMNNTVRERERDREIDVEKHTDIILTINNKKKENY